MAFRNLSKTDPPALSSQFPQGGLPHCHIQAELIDHTQDGTRSLGLIYFAATCLIGENAFVKSGDEVIFHFKQHPASESPRLHWHAQLNCAMPFPDLASTYAMLFQLASAGYLDSPSLADIRVIYCRCCGEGR